MRFFRTYILLLSCAVFAAAGPSAHAAFTKEEIKIGQDAAKEIEKESKLLKDEAAVKRVNDIGKALVAASSDPKAEYVFKVLDDKEVNAFALPGGFVFVYKGLLDKVQSDDELAGILAHEIVHADHHHGMKLAKKSKPFDMATIAVLLAGIFSGKDITMPAQVINVLQVSKVNGYTVDLEKEADAGGLKMMLKSKYNPVGMLTFMERLARTESRTGSSSVDLGIFRTHPYSEDRAQALRKSLEKEGVAINRRLVTNSIRASVDAVKDQDAATLKLDNKAIINLAADGSTSAVDRANEIAKRLNDLLDRDLRDREVKVGKSGTEVVARDIPVIKVTAADALLVKSTPEAVAAIASKHIKDALWGEFIRMNI